MFFSKALRAPRAGVTEQTLTFEEVQALYKDLFLSGEEISAGQSTAEMLSPVAAAHRILSNSFAMIPFDAYMKKGGERVPADDRQLSDLLKRQPGDGMTPFVLQKLVMSNAFWHGFGAVWNMRDSSGRVTARLPLPTDCCSISYDAAARQYWYTYTVDGVTRTFAPSELSFLFFETYNGVSGRGILDLAREAMAADAQAQRYGRKFYQNGARLSGILEVDTDTNREMRDKLKSEFARYASDDAFKIAVIDHGMKFTPIGVSQSDAQFVESRSFTVEEVARFTGIPKHMLQTGKESYDSNQQQRTNYVTDTLLPFITQWEQEEGRKLLLRRQRDSGVYIKGNPSVLMRGDDKSRAEFYERMIRNAIYNPDECRALEDRAPIPGGLGKAFFISKNWGSLEAVLKGEEK